MVALPYGRDPVTCPPCAFVRWRQLLHAWDTAASGEQRRAVMTVLRRRGGADAPEAQHYCRRATCPTSRTRNGLCFRGCTPPAPSAVRR